MKQFTKQLRWLLASLMLVVGVGTSWADDPFYTLDTTGSTNTTNSNYPNTGTATVDDIEWTFTGNGTMNPWRLGGKSLSNVDRTVYTNTAMGSAINKVVLTVGQASSITVNSLKLTVASDASFKTVLDEVSATFAASSDITFQPTTGTEWATGAYYKFTFNVTVNDKNKNKFVEFNGVKFYAPTAANAVATPTFSPAAGTYASAQSVELNTTTAGATIYYTTDGTDPTTSSSVYSSAISVSTTTTIKAIAVKEGMDNSTVASATYTIVNIEHAGTEAAPYTVADAIAYIGTLGSSTSSTVYVTGKISQIDSYNSTYGSITYWISDDGTTNNQMEVYSGLNLESAKFSSKDDIETGKTVTVCGTVKMYNGTPEFNYNNYLVYYEGATVDTRTETYIRFTQGDDGLNYPSGSDFTITVGEAFTSPEAWVTFPSGIYMTKTAASPYLSYSGDNDEVATVNSKTGVLTFVAGATGTITVTATFTGTTEYKPCTGSYTLKVNPAAVTPTGTGDEITAAFTGVESTSYTEWSNTGSSGAVYAGKTARDNSGNVQLRSKDSDCGIVTTTSPGKATMVTVEWGSGNTNDRKLDIYGSNTAYGSAADLYDSSKQGTKLGSIVYGTSTQLAIEGDYAYIGIRSNSGALYCNKITIYWETTPDTRTATTVTLNPSDESYEVTLGDDFTAPTATLDPAAAGTLTYESSDETVATVDVNTGAVTILAAGTTTITAKFAGNDDYKPSQASYTLTVTAPATVYTTIQQLQEAATSTSTDFEMQMTDIYVTAVKNNQAWISDGTYGALIYTAGHGLTAGKKLNGTITGKLVLYNGATEITNFDGSALTTTDEALAVQTKTIGQIKLANQSLPVKFEGVTYDATAKTFSDGTNTIAYYDQFSVSPTLEDGHVYNIAGLVIYYKKLQIAPLAATDVVDVTPAAAVEAPVFNPDGGTYTEDQTVTITTATTGASIFYTLDGTEPTTASTPYTAALTIGETTTLKAIASDGTNVSTVTTATYTINKPDVPNAKAYGTEYYTKVTDLSQIEDGDAVIIVNEADNVALSTTQNTNNRGEVAFEWMPWIGGSFVQLKGNSTVEKFIIDKDGDNFYFYASRGTEDGYIYAASSSSNQLKTSDTKSDNAKATITIENGDATIKFQGDNTRNWLRYNATSKLFACYTSGQQPVQIYVEGSTADVEALKSVTTKAVQDNYMTFVTPYDARFDGVNDHAYIVKLRDDQKEAILKEVSVVPAGTPIIYKNETASTHTITRAISGSDVLEDVSDNVLKVSRGEVEGDGTIFVLNKVNNVVGFYRLNEGKTLACGKCYLTIEKSSGVKFIGFNVDDVATGIETVESTMDKVQGTIYDLQGRRVTTPAHGLYIVNGKKVFIK